jgi:hypothetical protein
MIRVADDEKTGIVLLRDERADGSYVLLVCEEFERTGGRGVLGLPADDEETFPMLQDAEDNTRIHAERTKKKPFTIEVDLSNMPPGELRFQNGEFVEKAAQESQVLKRVEITPENAEEWGYVGGSRTQEA